MKVEAARRKAWEWVYTNVSQSPEFRGAYFSGSTVTLPEDSELPAGSDVDVIVVTAEAAPVKPGKFLYEGVLLEVTYLSLEEIATPERVLASYHLAGSFRHDTIIMDPSGHLQFLLRNVSAQFAQRTWVLRRCEEARQRVENGLGSIQPDAALHERMISLLFPGGVTTHILLVAALRNPTIRLRYLAARKVMEDYRLHDLYEKLLTLLGCRHWTPEQTEGHLEALAHTFDAAAEVSGTPFLFSSDISAAARAIAIDGGRELIRTGNHREAVFWIAATFARCHIIFAADAPHLLDQHRPPFLALLQDLGITSDADIDLRAKAVLDFLPQVWEAAISIMDANPDIH